MIPLSFAQRRMWLTHQLEGGAETYNISPAFRLKGPLDQAALVAAIGDVVARHETLRTTYVLDDNDEPHQRIVPAAQAPVQVPLVEVTPAALDEAVDAFIAHRFDLMADIPIEADEIETLMQTRPKSFSPNGQKRATAQTERGLVLTGH